MQVIQFSLVTSLIEKSSLWLTVCVIRIQYTYVQSDEPNTLWLWVCTFIRKVCNNCFVEFAVEVSLIFDSSRHFMVEVLMIG